MALLKTFLVLYYVIFLQNEPSGSRNLPGLRQGPGPKQGPTPNHVYIDWLLEQSVIDGASLRSLGGPKSTQETWPKQSLGATTTTTSIDVNEKRAVQWKWLGLLAQSCIHRLVARITGNRRCVSQVPGWSRIHPGDLAQTKLGSNHDDHEHRCK